MATAIIIQANDKQHERAQATKGRRRTWTKSKKDKETSAEEQVRPYKRGSFTAKKKKNVYIYKYSTIYE